MIIHPAQHQVIGRDTLSPGDIQLGYIDANNVEKEYRVLNVNHKSSIERQESVYPYEEFDRPDPYLFDKNKNLVSVATDMMRTDSGYAFFPAEAVEFHPAQLDFRVSLKKNFIYDPNRQVDLKVGVMEKNKMYAESLIKVFGDAYRKNLITSNFKVNSGDIKMESLTNLSIEECDMIFIESGNGKNYWDSQEIIDIDEMLDEHTNVWLCIGESNNILGVAESYYEFSDDFTLIGNTVYKEKRFADVKLDWCINREEIKKAFPMYEYVEDVYKYDVPVAILHKQDKGFLFVSHKSAALNAEKNYKLIYEMLNYVYTRGYTRTKWISGWITDNPVDYIPRKESIFGRNHEQYLVEELLDSRPASGDNVLIVNVEISQDTVSLKGIGARNEIYFEKTGGERDPEKSTGQRSYYTTRRTVILYTENSVNRLETPLSFSIEQTSKGDYLHVNEFKSTSLETNITEKTVLRIPDAFAAYCIVLKENLFALKRYDSIRDTDGYVLLVFELRKRSSVKSHDVRQFGGGLPEKLEANYNLLDVGHIKGRPYRKGGTMVIELPERLREYESYVRNAIERHISSGEHYLLVYVEQEA